MKLCMMSDPFVKRYGAKKAYTMLREAGFEAIDWSLYLAWDFNKVKTAEKLENLCIFEKSQEEIAAYYAEELAAIRESGLEIAQAHSPFPCYAPNRPDILEYAITLYQNMIPFLDSVGCKYLIVHGVSKNEWMDELTPASMEAMNMRLYESLIPTLKQCKNLTVCMENLFTTHLKLARGYWEGHCSNPNAAADMIDRLNEKAGKKCFGLCLDTGHLNLLRKPFYSFIPILGDRIVALHIHDNLQLADSHLMPYMGSVRWRDLVPELKVAGYKGDISFETVQQFMGFRLPDELVPSFLRLHVAIGENFREEFAQ